MYWCRSTLLATATLLVTTTVALLLGTGPVWGQPVISRVEGDAAHGATVTIHGSAFGSKDPAAPLIWDDAEQRTLDVPAAITDEGGWDEGWATPAMPVREAWKIQYRAAGFRGVGAPHDHSTSYVAGGHWSDAEDMGRNVAVTRDSGGASNQWYASWYVRLDPHWPEEDGRLCTIVPNYKDYVFQAGHASYTGSFNYSACTQCIVRRQSVIDIGHSHLCGQVAADPVPRPSELFGWKRREVVLQNQPGMLLTYTYDRDQRVQSYDRTCDQGGRLQEWDIRSFTVGGFMKNSDTPSNPPYDYPNWALLRDISDHWYTWVQRGGSDEYYATFSGDEVFDHSPDPGILVEPEIVRIDGADHLEPGTIGSLGFGEWGYGDADGLGFSTVYVRLPEATADRNPGDNGPCYAVLVGTAGKGNGRTHPDAFRYFDDLYIDNTLARVVLANAADVDQATVVEPQIPQSWQGDSIAVRVNLGGLTAGDSIYAFVFDSQNHHNSLGPCVAGPCLGPTDGGVDAQAGDAAEGTDAFNAVDASVVDAARADTSASDRAVVDDAAVAVDATAGLDRDAASDAAVAVDATAATDGIDAEGGEGGIGGEGCSCCAPRSGVGGFAGLLLLLGGISLRRYRTTTRVRYAETDASGIVYYGNYFIYFEVGRLDMFRELGLPYDRFLPIADTYCRYHASARFDEELEIETCVEEVRRCGFRLGHRVLRSGGEGEPELLVEGYTSMVLVDAAGKPTPLTSQFRAALGAG